MSGAGTAVLAVLLAVTVAVLVVVGLQRRRLAARLARLAADVALTEDVSGMGYWSRDVDSEAGHWSPGMYRIYGRDPATFTPSLSAVRDMIHPDDRHLMRKLTDPAATDGKGAEAEVRMFCADGSLKDVLVATRYRFKRPGEVAEVFGINLDITARKAAGRIVALREQQLQRAMAVMGAAVWDLDFATGILDANERWALMLGHDPAQFRLTLEAHDALIHPDDVARVRTLFCASPGVAQIDLEYRMRHAGGAFIWVHSRGQAEVDTKGQPYKMIGAVVDVTEQRAAAERTAKRAREATLLHEGVRLTSEATSFAAALQALIDMVCTTIGWPTGHAFRVEGADATALRSADIWHDDNAERYAQLKAINAGVTFAPGVGLPGEVWMAGRPIWIADIKDHPQFTHLAPIAGLHAAVAFPIAVRGEIRAIVEFFSDRAHDKDSDLLRVFESLGRQIGGVIERQEAADHLARQAREQYLLHAGMTLAAEATTFDEVVRRTLDLVCETVGWPVGHAYVLPQPEADELEPTDIWHIDDPARYAAFKAVTAKTRFRKGMGLPGRVWESSRATWVEDVAKDRGFVRGAMAPVDLHGAVCLPVRVGGAFRALLEFYSDRPVPKDMDLLRVFETLGLQIGSVIERQEAYSNLRSSRESLELAILASQAGHFDIDLLTGKAYWSPRLREMLDIKNPNFIPTAATITTYIHPDDQLEFLADMEEFRTSNRPLDREARVNLASGEQVWVHVRAMRQLNRDGKPIRTVGFIRDISRQKLAERAVAESERKFRGLVEGSIQGHVIHRRFKALFCNLSYAAMLGYERVEDVLALESLTIHVADAGYNADEIWARALKREYDGKSREVQVVDRNGRRKWVETVGQIINWEGEPAWQQMVMDVTERMEREVELRAARDRMKKQADELTTLAQNLDSERTRAENASAAKSQFLAMMSHELRTPMTGVLGMADLLMLSGLSAEQKELTQLLTRSARALLELLNDILDFSKIEAGQLEIESIPFRLADVVSDVKNLFAPVAAEKGLALETRLPPTYWNAVVGDPKRLRQVLSNLVGNAIKFTNKGRIEIGLAQTRAAAGGVVLKFSISDTGIGIKVADADRLFEPFVQADISTSRTYGGTGLGLAICRRLVTAMGGEISMESTPGRGSTFSFTVIVGHAKLGEAAPAEAETAAAAAPTIGRHILVAEDSETSRKLLEMMLARMGHQVSSVTNGAEAVAAARAGTYDIVLMDMQMPVLDGPDATREIRALGGAWANIPVIALTADVVPANRAGYFASGVNAIVAKPVDWAELDTEIARLLNGVAPAPAATQDAETPKRAAPPAAAEVIALDNAMIDSLVDALGESVLTPMLVTFRSSMAQYRDDLEAAVAEGDLKKAKRTAHALKGLCLQFGAARASDLAKFIEVDSKSLEEIAPLLPKVVETVSATERALAVRFPHA